jgi:hypothetical protein
MSDISTAQGSGLVAGSNNQYIRKVGLVVYGVGQSGSGAPSSGTGKSTPADAVPGLDLSAFRIKFHVEAMDIDMPPTAIIRVYNLADSTVQQIKSEFQNVTLQAGYVNGNYGVIFQGSIVRIRKGRVSNIDTFVDIMASNFDAVYNFGVVATTIAKGTNANQRAQAIKTAIANSPAQQGAQAQAGNALANGLQYGNIPDSFNTGGTLPRGKVLFGLGRDHLSDLADTTGTTWSVGPDGKVNFIPLDGYLPGEAVVITAQTGMIGIPEATQQGIEVTTLLNPKIKSGTRIQLDNASINTTQTNNAAAGFPAFGDFQFFASTSDDGFYRAIVVEHEGDSRGTGNDWITKIIALNVDQSGGSGPDGTGSVQPYGGPAVSGGKSGS